MSVQVQWFPSQSCGWEYVGGEVGGGKRAGAQEKSLPRLSPQIVT